LLEMVEFLELERRHEVESKKTHKNQNKMWMVPNSINVDRGINVQKMKVRVWKPSSGELERRVYKSKFKWVGKSSCAKV
jgi:hypothetical protein